MKKHSVIVFEQNSLNRLHEEVFSTAAEAYSRYCQVIDLLRELGVDGKGYKVTRWIDDRLQAYEDVTGTYDPDFPF